VCLRAQICHVPVARPPCVPRAHVRKKQSVAHTGQKQTDRHSNARGHALRVRVRCQASPWCPLGLRYSARTGVRYASVCVIVAHGVVVGLHRVNARFVAREFMGARV